MNDLADIENWYFIVIKIDEIQAPKQLLTIEHLNLRSIRKKYTSCIFRNIKPKIC